MEIIRKTLNLKIHNNNKIVIRKFEMNAQEIASFKLKVKVKVEVKLKTKSKLSK